MGLFYHILRPFETQTFASFAPDFLKRIHLVLEKISHLCYIKKSGHSF